MNRVEEIKEIEQAVQQRAQALANSDPIIQKWIGRLELLKELENAKQTEESGEEEGE